MFGKGKSGPADELYLEQKGRNGNYSHDYEYRTIGALNIEKFDLELGPVDIHLDAIKVAARFQLAV